MAQTTPPKVAFITGASSGIGHAVALKFAARGVHVAGVARREAALKEVASQIEALPTPCGEFLAIVGDVTSITDVEAAVAQATTHFGRIDYVVVNAGVGHRGALADAEWGDLQTLLRINIEGALHTIRATVPVMRKQGGGHILTVSSVAASLVSPYAAIYAASKAFLTSIANSIRLELRDDNIRVTDFLIGRTETGFNTNRLGEGQRKKSSLPTMTAEEVAQAIVDAAGTNKQTVIVRLFDWLIVQGNRFVPSIIGRMAEKQYK